MTKKEMILHVMLKESTADMLAKMMIAHVLTMPKGGEHYYECVSVVVEFLEECIPAHPGAFAAYYKVLELMPAKRSVPEAIAKFTKEHLVEIEKYYEGQLSPKYRPSLLVVPDNGLVDANGMPASMKTPPSLILS